MAYQVLPWYQFQAVAWHQGELPLWDPHVWGGQPLVGQLQPGAAYPLNWALFLLPLRHGRIHQVWLHLSFVLAHFLAALFCYQLCRDLRRSVAASILAGCSFALAGVVGAIGWPQMLNGAIWMPLALMFFLRSSSGQRPMANAAISGAFLGVSFLSGHHQIPTFTGVMMGALWLFQFWRKRTRALGPMAAFALFAGAVSALQVFPAYEYGMRSLRWVGSENGIFWGQSVPYSVHQQYSLAPIAILGLAIRGESMETFVGVSVLTLALLGFVLQFSIPVVRILGAISAGGLVFALGGFSVFHGMAYLLVPLMEKARTPSMAIVIVQLALAVLAAYGLDALRCCEPSNRLIGVLAGSGLLAWSVLAIVSKLRPEGWLDYGRVAIAALVSVALAMILQGWKSKAISERALAALLCIVTLFEIGTVTGTNYRHRETPGGLLHQLNTNADVVEFLRKQGDFVRLEVDTEALPYNIGDWDGIDQFRAYLGGMTSNVARFEKERLDGGSLAVRLFGLSHFAGLKPIRPHQVELVQGASGLKIYRNPEPGPRFWTVHEATSTSPSELIARLQSTDLQKQALFIDTAPELEQCGGDIVRLLERSASRVALEANMACKGLVVLSQTFYPGWKATVDGHPARMLEPYGVLQGVVVEKGTHRIEITYRPLTVYWGAALTFGGLLATAFLMMKARVVNSVKSAVSQL